MTYSVSISDTDVFTALRAFLLSAFGGEVIRGIQNRVASPKVAFIAMSPSGLKRISTNIDTVDIEGETKTVTMHTQACIQLDFYGSGSANQAEIFTALWRDDTSCVYFSDNHYPISPLDCSDPAQIPLVNGEQQYEQRWVIKAFLQYNAAVTLDQPLFTGVEVALIDVDTTYPPS